MTLPANWRHVLSGMFLGFGVGLHAARGMWDVVFAAVAGFAFGFAVAVDE